MVRSDQIVASDPGDKDMYFDPMEDKVYRHPTFYELPDSSTTCRTWFPPKRPPLRGAPTAARPKPVPRRPLL